MYEHKDKPRTFISGRMIRQITTSLIRNRFDPNEAMREIIDILSPVCPMAATAKENNKRNEDAVSYEVHFSKDTITKVWHL